MLFSSIHIQRMFVVVETVAIFSLSPGFPSVISLDNAVLCDVRAMYTVVSVNAPYYYWLLSVTWKVSVHILQSPTPPPQRTEPM